MWLVAGVMAGLNFLHGLETSFITGVVMAVVAAAGLVIHQIKVGLDAAPARDAKSSTLGRRCWWTPLRSVAAAYRSARTGRPVVEVYDGRSRGERRLDRKERRQVRAIRRAAVARAVGEIHADGTVTLLHSPAKVALYRTRRGLRRVLREIPAEALPAVANTPPTTAPASGTEKAEWGSQQPAQPVQKEAPASSDGSASAAAQDTPELEPSDGCEPPQPSELEALPAEAGSGDDAASEDPSPSLIDQAERLERQYLARSGGKRGLPFREAPRRLGVRYDTARAALVAARDRMAEDSELIAA